MPRIIKPVAKGDFTSATLSVDSQGRETDWVPTEQFNVLAEEMAAKWKKNMKVTRERPKGYVASKSKDPYLNKFA